MHQGKRTRCFDRRDCLSDKRDRWGNSTEDRLIFMCQIIEQNGSSVIVQCEWLRACVLPAGQKGIDIGQKFCVLSTQSLNWSSVGKLDGGINKWRINQVNKRVRKQVHANVCVCVRLRVCVRERAEVTCCSEESCF